MYPKLNDDPVALYINGRTLKIPREKIAAAYAGSMATKEMLLWESNPLTSTGEDFKNRYQKVMPSCIYAANSVGLSAVVETLEYWRPGKDIDQLLIDRMEHPDNPFYPFFEED